MHVRDICSEVLWVIVVTTQLNPYLVSYRTMNTVHMPDGRVDTFLDTRLQVVVWLWLWVWVWLVVVSVSLAHKPSDLVYNLQQSHNMVHEVHSVRVFPREMTEGHFHLH